MYLYAKPSKIEYTQNLKGNTLYTQFRKIKEDMTIINSSDLNYPECLWEFIKNTYHVFFRQIRYYIEWASSMPPKPHAFVSSPLESGIGKIMNNCLKILIKKFFLLISYFVMQYLHKLNI